MADDGKTMNGEMVEDQTVNIGGDEEITEYELKIAELSDEIALMEKEKNQVVYENKSLNDRVRKMKESMENLSVENEGLKVAVEKLGAENKSLQAVVSRAADLEGEVARMQHDLISAMSDLQEANGVIDELKSKLKGLEDGDGTKGIEFDAVVGERDLLVSKVADLEAKGLEKEKEIKGLKGRIEELKVSVREKEELDKKLKEIEGKLVEKERVIRGLEFDGNRKVAGVEDEDLGIVAEGREKKGNILDGLKKIEWPVVAVVSTVSAVAVMGVGCYLHSARRK